MSVELGAPAPDFSGKINGGGKVSLSDFIGKKNVVLYFYPKDDTPGCVVEACGFRDDMERFHSADAEIIGVSRDSEASHDAFAEKHHLPFPLLVDEEGAVCRSFGALDEGGAHPRRITVIVDKAGVVRRIFDPVNVKTHSREVLDALAAL